ncbi:MAG: antibiotic biosynthesis monooxygenase [Desulfobacterales bacterium]|jgi:heme-degrading monooxygenase HmoA
MVKVMIKRHIKKGMLKDVYSLLKEQRAKAMNQRGHVRGETLSRYQNPNCLLVISMWMSMENWLAWKENKERRVNEEKLEQFLESPTEYDEYIFGTYPEDFQIL